MELRLSFVAPSPTKGLTINAIAGHHWRKHHHLKKVWQNAAFSAARSYLNRCPEGSPDPACGRVTVRISIPFKRGARRDAHNYTGTVVKWIIDGLVRAGMLADDSTDHVDVRDSLLPVDPSMTVVVQLWQGSEV